MSTTPNNDPQPHKTDNPNRPATAASPSRAGEGECPTPADREGLRDYILAFSRRVEKLAWTRLIEHNRLDKAEKYLTELERHLGGQPLTSASSVEEIQRRLSNLVPAKYGVPSIEPDHVEAEAAEAGQGQLSGESVGVVEPVYLHSGGASPASPEMEMKMDTSPSTLSDDEGPAADEAHPPEAIPAKITKAEPPKQATEDSFASLCEVIRKRVVALERSVVRELLVVADLVVAAKRKYETETGTGHGKGKASHVTPFVGALAEAIGKSPSFVQRLITISTLDAKSRAVAAELGFESHRKILQLAREADLEKRAAVLAAYATDGDRGFDRALSEPSRLAVRAHADPGFAALLKQVADDKTLLGGVGGAVRPELRDKYPEELRPFETMQQLKAAARAALKEPKTHNPKERPESVHVAPPSVAARVEPSQTTFAEVLLGLHRSAQDLMAMLGVSRLKGIPGIEDLLAGSVVDPEAWASEAAARLEVQRYNAQATSQILSERLATAENDDSLPIPAEKTEMMRDAVEILARVDVRYTASDLEGIGGLLDKIAGANDAGPTTAEPDTTSVDEGKASGSGTAA